MLAQDGDAALQALASQPVGVLLTDQRMPGMTGIELCERARDLHPEVLRVVVTAYSDERTAIDAINRGRVSRFVRKPWDEVELRQVLRDCVARVFLAQTVRELRTAMHDRDRLLGESASLARLQRDIDNLGGSLRLATKRLLAVHDQLRDRLPGPLHVAYGEALQEVDRYVERMVELGPSEHHRALPRLEKRPLRPLVQAAQQVAQERVAGAGAIGLDIAHDLLVWTDATELSRVLVRLLSNAARMASAGADGGVRVRAARAGGSVAIEIHDGGPTFSAVDFAAWLAGGASPPDPSRCDAELADCAPLLAAIGATLDVIESGSAEGGHTWLLSVPADRPRPAPLLRQS